MVMRISFLRRLLRDILVTSFVLNIANQCKIEPTCTESHSFTVVTLSPFLFTAVSTNLFAMSLKISQAEVQVKLMISTARSAGRKIAFLRFPTFGAFLVPCVQIVMKSLHEVYLTRSSKLRSSFSIGSKNLFEINS